MKRLTFLIAVIKMELIDTIKSYDHFDDPSEEHKYRKNYEENDE